MSAFLSGAVRSALAWFRRREENPPTSIGEAVQVEKDEAAMQDEDGWIYIAGPAAPRRRWRDRWIRPRW